LLIFQPGQSIKKNIRASQIINFSADIGFDHEIGPVWPISRDPDTGKGINIYLTFSPAHFKFRPVGGKT